MLHLVAETAVGAITTSPRFCVRLRDRRDVTEVERAYMWHTNGGDGEGFFTKNIRRFSIPLSTRLVRLGVRVAAWATPHAFPKSSASR